MSEEEKTILICCDTKEKDLAKEVQKIISSGSGYSVRLCSVDNGQKEAGEKVWKTLFNKNLHLIFILCSPYSIGQQGINFISGVATMYAKGKNIVIPICHSGQNIKDLPHYLLTRQTLTLESGRFVKDIWRLLNVSSSLDNENEVTVEKQRQEKFDNWLLTLKNSEVSPSPENGAGTHGNDKSDNPILLSLKRDGDVIQIDEASAQGTANLKDCLEFLASGTSEINGVAVSFGVQHCLFDGDNIFVGLRIGTEVDADFRSFCRSTGSFDPGYRLLTEPPTSADDFFNGDQQQFVRFDDDIYKKLMARAEAQGIKLWKIKIGGENRIATIFVHATEKGPRFEIGVWKFIDISTIKNQEIVGNFGHDKENDKENIHYWIWVKDGEIHYWSWPSEQQIPRYVNPESEQERTTVLVKTQYMNKQYGRPGKYTPFAADEVLGFENVVKEQFSAAARALLSIF